MDIYEKGVVSYPQFHQALEKIGIYYSIDDVAVLMENFYDADGSGLIDYKEFSRMLFGATRAQ